MRTAFFGAAALGMVTALDASSPAIAYTPQWMECTGEQVITMDGAATRQPITDVYVYDADAQNLFRYSDSQKRLSLVGAKPVSNQILSWSGTGSGIPSSSWVGQLDRATMSLRMTYKNGPETREWAQSCKPTNPRPETWQLPTS